MPRLIVKRKPEPPTKCLKFIITKKDTTNHSYPVVTQNHILHPVKHEQYHVPRFLDLEAFFCQGTYFCLDKNSGYLFFPHDIRERCFEPIGQIQLLNITTPDRNQAGDALIKERKINWFMKYDPDLEPELENEEL